MASYQTYSDVVDARNAVLADNWWALALRGGLAILFAIVAFASPGTTMLALVFVFAAYSVVDGILTCILAVRGARTRERWGLLLLNGLFSIVVGVAAAVWPGIAVLAFVLMIAAWALVSAGLMLGAALDLKISHGRWLLVFSAVVSLIYGLLLIASPLFGALVLTWWAGLHALVFGAGLVVLAIQLRSHRDHRTSAHIPASV